MLLAEFLFFLLLKKKERGKSWNVLLALKTCEVAFLEREIKDPRYRLELSE